MPNPSNFAQLYAKHLIYIAFVPASWNLSSRGTLKTQMLHSAYNFTGGNPT